MTANTKPRKIQNTINTAIKKFQVTLTQVPICKHSQLTVQICYKNYSVQGRIIQCAQCACAHEAPPHWRTHQQANMKIVIDQKFVIEIKCTETMTTKKVTSFYGEKKLWRPHQNGVHSAEIG